MTLDFLAALVGTWQADVITATGCNDSEENGQITCDPYCLRIEINSNGTYTLSQVNFETQMTESESGAITVTSNQITLCRTGANCSDEDPGTYVKTSDTSLTITFTDNDDSPGCQFSTVFTKQ